MLALPLLLGTHFFQCEAHLFSSTRCSHPPLSRQHAATSHLDSFPFHKLVIWTDDCLISARKRRLRCPCQTAHSMVLGPPFPIRQPLCIQGLLVKPAPFCSLFIGCGSPNKSATSLPSSHTLTLFLLHFPLFHVFTSHTLYHKELFSLLLLHQAAISQLSLISFGQHYR